MARLFIFVALAMAMSAIAMAALVDKPTSALTHTQSTLLDSLIRSETPSDDSSYPPEKKEEKGYDDQDDEEEKGDDDEYDDSYGGEGKYFNQYKLGCETSKPFFCGKKCFKVQKYRQEKEVAYKTEKVAKTKYEVKIDYKPYLADYKIIKEKFQCGYYEEEKKEGYGEKENSYGDESKGDEPEGGDYSVRSGYEEEKVVKKPKYCYKEKKIPIYKQKPVESKFPVVYYETITKPYYVYKNVPYYIKKCEKWYCETYTCTKKKHGYSEDDFNKEKGGESYDGSE